MFGEYIHRLLGLFRTFTNVISFHIGRRSTIAAIHRLSVFAV